MSIGVVIPVGPWEHNKRWLPECLESVANQTRKPDEVIIVDDMSNLSYKDVLNLDYNIRVKIIKNVWLMGVAHSFNIGVMSSSTDCTFMLGSDDTLEPTCLEECEKIFEQTKERYRTYFWVGLRYMDSGNLQFLPCNAALVTKELWKHNGGFPPESGVGAPDGVLVETMQVHPEAGTLKCVNERKHLYNYRQHSDTHTRTRPPYFVAIQNMRIAAVNGWIQPKWERFRER